MVTKSYSRVLGDIHTMTHEEIEDCYGVTIGEDGTVWDQLDGIEHESLLIWAHYCIDQEESDNLHIHRNYGRMQYDD